MAQTVCVIVSGEDRVRLEAVVADRNRALKHAYPYAGRRLLRAGLMGMLRS